MEDNKICNDCGSSIGNSKSTKLCSKCFARRSYNDFFTCLESQKRDK